MVLQGHPEPPRFTHNPYTGAVQTNTSWSSTHASTKANAQTEASLLRRQLSALALIYLLYTAAYPFNPFAWFLFAILELPTALLLDRVFSGIFLLAGVYFQWRIASVHGHLVPVYTPASSAFGQWLGRVFGGDKKVLRDGRLEAAGWGSWLLGKKGQVMFVWQPRFYWVAASVEAALLLGVEYEVLGPNEWLRRVVMLTVLTALWTVGWSSTPPATRTWAWDAIKNLALFLAIREILGLGGCCGGPGVRGRPGRRFR